VRPSTMIRAGIYQRMPLKRARRFAFGGLLLLAVSAALSQVPPLGRFSAGGYTSVVVAVGGFAALTPLALIAASAALRRPFGRAYGVIGTLATVSLPASLRRVAVAGAALSTAIGMMVAVSMMVGSFRETVEAWVSQTVQSDLWLRPAKGIGTTPAGVFPAAISDDLRKFDFIEYFDRIRLIDIVFRDELIVVGGGDFASVVNAPTMPMVDPERHRQALTKALEVGGVMISETLSIRHELGVGDAIELPTATGTRRFPITGVYRDYSNDRGVIIMDRADFIRSYRDDTINTIAVFLKPGVDPDQARRQLESALGRKYRVFAITNSSIRAEVMKIFDQTFLITWALLIVAVVVAVLGIVNTLSALILERTREIALLKVLGTTPGQIRQMILLESAVLGIVGAVLGLITGYVLSWILIFVINKQSFGWTIQFDPPAGVVAVSLAITFAATVLAGLYPAAIANRIALAAALKRE
jgi:putative ABC transport system permease protein